MDTFKEFLESSTIHGLVYISTSRRLLKLFWLCVVITGFTGAVYRKMPLKMGAMKMNLFKGIKIGFIGLLVVRVTCTISQHLDYHLL